MLLAPAANADDSALETVGYASSMSSTTGSTVASFATYSNLSLYTDSHYVSPSLTDWIQEHSRSELSSSDATTGGSGASENEDYR